MSQAFEALKAEVLLAKVSMAKAQDAIVALVAKIPSSENVVDPADVVATTADLRTSADALDAAVAAATAPPAA